MSWSSNISNYPNSSIYESRQQKISVDILRRPIFTKKKLNSFYLLGYQGPFWQPNSPSLLSFCFFHQFDCYDVIDYCRNNCPQFTGCGTCILAPYIWFQGYQSYLFDLCQISQKCQIVQVWNTQCRNFRDFLPLRFYV